MIDNTSVNSQPEEANKDQHHQKGVLNQRFKRISNKIKSSRKTKIFLSLGITLLIFGGIASAFLLLQKNGVGDLRRMALGPTQNTQSAETEDNVDHPYIRPNPILEWGNSSFHDSLGIRDPFVISHENTYYLYYDCIEDFYNPSFESKLSVNGWDTFAAAISTTDKMAVNGESSLVMITSSQLYAGAYTGNYYYNLVRDDKHLASPTGLEIKPNTDYIASAYVWANSGQELGIIVQQYSDDPLFFNQNKIKNDAIQAVNYDHTNHWFYSQITSNGQWQRIEVPFKTDGRARAITISLASFQDKETISYWDAVQLERVQPSQTQASAFPDFNFNRNLNEIVGWKICLATAPVTEDITQLNFTKKGLVTLLSDTTQGVYEKPGWVGSSFMYSNVFPYQDKWYAYIWQAGHPVSADLIQKNGAGTPIDTGIKNQRRLGYGDYRAQLPNGIPSWSGLIVADDPEGPFVRVEYPVVTSDDYIVGGGGCTTEIRNCSTVFGCDYLTTIGVPHKINEKWVIFLAGATYYEQGKFAGTMGKIIDDKACHAINAGLATSDSPLGPWIPADYNPIFSPEEVYQVARTSLEGPIYYYDQSGKHTLFLNAISGGAHALKLVWTDEPLQRWPLNNLVNVIDHNSTAYNWDEGQRGKGHINLSTVVESPAENKLFVFFGVKSFGETEDYQSYLFHDIGLLSYDLPLFSSDIQPTTEPTDVSPTLNPELPTFTPTPIQELEDASHKIMEVVYPNYKNTLNSSSKVNQAQLLITKNYNWRIKPEYLRAMYIVESTQIGEEFFEKGVYIYDISAKNTKFGWKGPVSVDQTIENQYAQVKVQQVLSLADGLKINWKINFKEPMWNQTFNSYRYHVNDDNQGKSYIDSTQDYFSIEHYGVDYHFAFLETVKVGNY